MSNTIQDTLELTLVDNLTAALGNPSNASRKPATVAFLSVEHSILSASPTDKIKLALAILGSIGAMPVSQESEDLLCALEAWIEGV